MPNRPNIRQMLMPAADTLALRKRAMESQDQAELLNNPQALEYFKQKGATDEEIDRMRRMMSKQATAQADSLAQMRAEMRQASTGRAREAFGNEAMDRAQKAGYNVIAEEPAGEGRSAYTFERRGTGQSKYVPTKGTGMYAKQSSIEYFDPLRMTVRARSGQETDGTTVTRDMTPDEDTLREMAFGRAAAAGRMTPQAYSDSIMAVRRRRGQ